MDNLHQKDINQDNYQHLLKQAGKDAIRAILTEDARVQALPIVQKAGVVSDLVISFAESLGDSEAENQYKTILIKAGFEICNKLVIAENSPYFNNRIEQALLVKLAVKKVLCQLDGLEVQGWCDTSYSGLIKKELEVFRQLFNEWVGAFDKSTYLSDGWDLLNG
ncbi:MAG: hypothetical protein ACKOX3_03060 [Bacteroidota bacterium]